MPPPPPPPRSGAVGGAPRRDIGPIQRKLDSEIQKYSGDGRVAGKQKEDTLQKLSVLQGRM